MTETAPTEIRIRALAHGGAGVGEPLDDGGPTWFVPGTLPGETVVATPERRGKRWVHGRLMRVITASEQRVEPPCSLSEQCGGCSWQHIEPGVQASLKREIVVNVLRAVVDAAKIVDGFAGEGLSYRRRVRMHYTRSDDDVQLGFYQERSRSLLDVPSCPVLVPVLDRAMQRLREVPRALRDTGEALGLTDGTTVVIGLPGLTPEPERMAMLRSLVGPEIQGISVRGARRRGHVGRATLALDGGGGLSAIPADPYTFSQSQNAGNQALVRYVMARSRPDGKRVLELFAGSGNMTRGLARTAAGVWASDTDHEAIDRLRGLSTSLGLPIRAKRQDAPALLEKLEASHTTYDVVVVDPPRHGLGKRATQSACRVATDRLVYVSCDPATLARDLEVAKQYGFDVLEVAVFDMMPMTPEIELVATLIPRGGA